MPEREAAELDIQVRSEDPPKDDDKPLGETGDKGKQRLNDDEKDKGKGKDDSDEMSEEDLQLKAELEMLVERLKESDTTLYSPALESLRTLIRTSTSSMTAVPKPLKFLRPHYDELGSIWKNWAESLAAEKALLASILSVLAMTYSDTGKRDTLRYRLLSKSTEEPGLWGHEYVRHLAAELGEEYNHLIVDTDDTDPTPTEPNEAVANGEKVNGDHKPEAMDVERTNDVEEESEVREKFSTEELRALGLQLVKFFLRHNAEADAVDLLLELECIQEIEGAVDDKTYPRVCQYMVSCVPLLVPPDDRAFLQSAAAVYAKFDRYPEAVALAVKLNDRSLIRKYYEAPLNPVMKKQLSYFLARAQIPLHWVHTAEGMEADSSDEFGTPPQLSDDVLECLGNVKLSEYFRNFGKAVGVEEPKSVEDIYKSHLDNSRTIQADSAQNNLASTFVNAFVNAGFGNDKLMVNAPEGQSWIYKNKDQGMMSATASIGMSMLWDSEAGIDHIDKYSYSSEEHIKAGASLAMGILHSGIKTDPDVAYALLEEHVDSKSIPLKISAINGIGIAYTGSARADISEKLLPHVADETNSMEVASMAALALAFVHVGSADGEIASAILQTMMEREESQLTSNWAIFMGVALGLIYLGAQDSSDATIATLKAIEHPLARQAEILVNVCSYAGTGNVLKIQELLHVCAEHASDLVPKPTEEETATLPEAETEDDATPVLPLGEPSSSTSATSGPGVTAVTPNAMDDIIASMTGGLPSATGGSSSSDVPAGTSTGEDGSSESPKPPVMRHQAIAVIGISLIAMGEEVGAEMALRQFQHLMTYGDPIIRKSVPLALGLISASNPQLTILDTLSKYSHDTDLEVAVNSIFAMGLVGAGTNNARLAQMLRALAVYYAKEQDCLFVVRVAQGLVHLGKGTIGINPFFGDGGVMSKTAVAGLLAVLVSFIEAKSFVLGNHHWMLYWLVTAMYPQFLTTLDEDLNEKAVTVRVGQAVNTVGQAGQRRGIAGFQTHQTPVRIATAERAELGTNEFFPYTSVLEGLVILKKNEGYDAED